MKKLLLVFILSPVVAFAHVDQKDIIFYNNGFANFVIQCGNFKLRANSNGWLYINGEKPFSQKINYFGQKPNPDNVEFTWVFQDPETSNFVQLSYLKRDGKAILFGEAMPWNGTLADAVPFKFKCESFLSPLIGSKPVNGVE